VNSIEPTTIHGDERWADDDEEGDEDEEDEDNADEDEEASDDDDYPEDNLTMWPSLPIFTTPRSLLPLLLLSNLTNAFTSLSPAALHSLPKPLPGDLDPTNGSILSPILIPRVPGTPGSTKVLQHFQQFFSQSLPSWSLSTQNSTQTTPLSAGKKIPFTNFIATKDPPWAKAGDVGRIVMVAHYDSKVTPEGFIGATDSAVPCAVILWAAKAIDAALTSKWATIAAMEGEEGKKARQKERGVMVLMLDGEEAWESWSDTDSLYGARDLARVWEEQTHPPMSTRKNELGNIDLFVLLDLLGCAAPRIPSYFPTTHWAYKVFAETEERLRKEGLMETGKTGQWFYEKDKDTQGGYWYGGAVQDDHVPFLKRGVEVLHLIPSPFPGVWHTSEDDGEHLDKATVKDWARLTAAWLGGVMGVQEQLGGGKLENKAGLGKRGNVKTEL
jgi:glutaminyl-peptide cyclotransferase